MAGLRASAAWAEQPETIAMCDFECLGYKPLQLFVPSHKRLRLSHDGHCNDKAVQLGRRYYQLHYWWFSPCVDPAEHICA